MNLSFSDSLAVIGLVTTIVLGIWGLKATIRKNYPGKISFIEETSLSLFNSIIRNFSEIKILYNSNLVDEQLIYVKASLVNVGSIDLSTSNSNQKLRCTTISNLKWVDAKLTGKSKNVECIISVDEKNLEFDFDLLRKDEFLQFEALISKNSSVEKTHSTKELFKFTHRIPNTSDVKTDSLANKTHLKREEFDYKFRLVMYSLLLVGIAGFIIYNIFFDQFRLVYEYFNNGSVSTVIVTPNGATGLDIKNYSNDFDRSISLKDFNNNDYIKAAIVKKKLSDYSYLISLFILTLVITIAQTMYDVMKINRAKKIIKILEQEEVKLSV